MGLNAANSRRNSGVKEGVVHRFPMVTSPNITKITTMEKPRRQTSIRAERGLINTTKAPELERLAGEIHHMEVLGRTLVVSCLFETVRKCDMRLLCRRRTMTGTLKTCGPNRSYPAMDGGGGTKQ
jgi:hypothetical protein